MLMLLMMKIWWLNHMEERRELKGQTLDRLHLGVVKLKEKLKMLVIMLLLKKMTKMELFLT